MALLRDNEIGMDQLAAVAIAGMMGGGGGVLLGKMIFRRQQRAVTKKFFSSLLLESNNQMALRGCYLPREGQGGGAAAMNRLNLLEARRPVALIGDNRSGKSTFIAHHVLYEMFPWWYRIFFPPRGLFLCGEWWRGHATMKEWLSSQVPKIEDRSSSDPMSAIEHMVSVRYNEQRFRLFLHKFFDGKLPRLLKPQPVVIVVDQAEELLRRFRADFLAEFTGLAKRGRDHDTLRLVLVVNSDHAVDALDLVYGGDMFDVVAAPNVSRDAVSAAYGEALAQTFDDCGGCFGVATEFERDEKRKKKPAMSARDFSLMMKDMYTERYWLTEPISREEYDDDSSSGVLSPPPAVKKKQNNIVMPRILRCADDCGGRKEEVGGGEVEGREVEG
jgi:hypothetical protein